MKEYYTFKDLKHNFFVNYPKEWTIEKSQGALIFISKAKEAADKFRENFNIMIQNLGEHNLNLDSYTNLTKQMVIDNLGESAILGLKDKKICNFDAKEFKYQMTMDGNNLIVLQNWFIKDYKAYLFTYTAERESFEIYLRTANKILNSFKFTVE